MKTPREILFDRHKAIETKLDAVRQNALATLVPRTAPELPRDRRRGCGRQSLRELIFSLRWHLGALATAWLVVLALNFEDAPALTGGIARAKIPASREVFAALLEHRRELLELTDAPSADEPAILPPRRTEVQSIIAVG